MAEVISVVITDAKNSKAQIILSFLANQKLQVFSLLIFLFLNAIVKVLLLECLSRKIA